MNLWNIETTHVQVERVIEATAAEVFDAWLDPTFPGSPWNGVTRAILQPVVDGLFYRVHPAEKGDYDLAHYGRFLVVERPTTVQYTWVSQHTRGLESVVTVRLEARGDATRVVIHHENLPDDEKGRGHAGGWNHLLGQLSARLNASR